MIFHIFDHKRLSSNPYMNTSPADARIPYSIGDAEFENSFKLKPFPVYSQHKVLYVKCNISFSNYLASI